MQDGRIAGHAVQISKLSTMYIFFKVLLTAGLVVVVSEGSKRSALLGGILASLPIVSFMAMIWLYADTGSTEKVADLSRSIFWLVLPSLPFFLLLPYLLKREWGFTTSLIISTAVMVVLYFVMLQALKKVGIELK